MPCGVSDQDIQDLCSRMLTGKRPFEDKMRAHGHSDEEIAEIYRMIDRWLMLNGITSKQSPLPNRN